MTEILPDEAKLLSRLQLNATDAARVSGVTVRQLTYWTDKGIIPSRGGSGRSYDVVALRKAMAIKRLMLQGYTLEKAAATLGEQARQASAEGMLGGGESVVAYFDDLVSRVETCHERLPAYIALAGLKEAAANLEGLDLDRLLASEPGQEEAARHVAGHLEAATRELDRVLAQIISQVGAGEAREVERVPEASGAFA